MRCQRLERGSGSEVSPYKEPSDSSDEETESQIGDPGDDEYEVSSTKRDQPPAKRVKMDDETSQPAPTAFAFQGPEIDMEEKVEPKKPFIVIKKAKEAKVETRPRPSARKKKTTEERLAACEKQVAEIKRTHTLEMNKIMEHRLEEADKFTDETIERLWILLDFNINSIAIQLSALEFKQNSGVLEVLQSRLPEILFKGVSKDSMKYFVKALLKSFIWHFLYTDFFLGCGRQWKGGVVKNIQKMRRDLIATEKNAKSLAECAKWLALGHSMIVVQPDKEALQQMADEFTDTLFSMILVKQRHKSQGQVSANLGNVVRLATDLTKLFLSSKAILMPDWPCRGSKYKTWSPHEVEQGDLTDDGSEDRYLVGRPALQKFGNADGGNLHQSTILRKPELVYY